MVVFLVSCTYTCAAMFCSHHLWLDLAEEPRAGAGRGYCAAANSCCCLYTERCCVSCLLVVFVLVLHSYSMMPLKALHAALFLPPRLPAEKFADAEEEIANFKTWCIYGVWGFHLAVKF